MSFWQYNAWCEAYQSRMADQLSVQVQAAYLGAYWGGASKNKKSLKSVLNAIQKGTQKHKRKKIKVDEVAERFRQFEELQKYGRTKVKSNNL